MNDHAIQSLAEEIKNSDSRNPVRHVLETSDRVLKRITDGIYRQPASALRELISNSYDADATKVTIETDRPRFKEISIQDDGNGFTAEALAWLVKSIGGSAKRVTSSIDLGVTDPEDSGLSPNGRPLIGKIGIGLFSVAQLTKEFTIVSKVEGDRCETVAKVKLQTYEEETANYATGEAQFWRQESSGGKSSHGTRIVLTNLLPKTRDDLSSEDRWVQSYDDSYLIEPEDAPPTPPKYHIGFVLKHDRNLIREKPNLPWESTDSPKKKFEKLVVAIMDEATGRYAKPKLADLLDGYLQMIWNLGLEIPVPYLRKHPFKLNGADGYEIFRLSNSAKGKATQEELKSKTIEKFFNLKSLEKEDSGIGEFRVFIDGIEILRPLLYDKTKTEDGNIKPLVFVGQAKPNLSHIPKEIRGGDLEFEAYLSWQQKVVPVEHRGVLIRIRNANGTLFDSTFMKYPVSEQSRKEQVTAEIFVLQGMDAALNIDRESFNFSHPHYSYVRKWLHSAFRQLATAHKRLLAEKRKTSKAESTVRFSEEIENIVRSSIKKIGKTEEEILRVRFVDENEETILSDRRSNRIVFNERKIFRRDDIPTLSASNKEKFNTLRAQLEAITEILTAYGVLDHLSFDEQEGLLEAIAGILSASEGPAK